MIHEGGPIRGNQHAMRWTAGHEAYHPTIGGCHVGGCASCQGNCAHVGGFLKKIKKTLRKANKKFNKAVTSQIDLAVGTLGKVIQAVEPIIEPLARGITSGLTGGGGGGLGGILGGLTGGGGGGGGNDNPQVTNVPTGGVPAGGGSDSGLQQVWLFALGGCLLLAASTIVIRHRLVEGAGRFRR